MAALDHADFRYAVIAPATTIEVSAHAFSFGDYDKIVTVSDPQISPDDTRAAIVVSRIDIKRDRSVNQIVLVDLATGARRALTYGRDSVSLPRWSPDGKRLAFVGDAGAGKDARPQVWVLPMGGGDARPATSAKNGVETFTWSPDGRAVAYVTADNPKNAVAIAQHDDLFLVGDDSFATRAAPVPSHLWLQPLGAPKPERLTEGSWSIYPDQISWSSDGRYIAFDRMPDAHHDSLFRTRVSVLDVATKRVTEVSHVWSWQPAFALRGDELAFAAGANGTSVIQMDAEAVDAPSSGARALAPALDRNVKWLAWRPNGGLVLAADDRVTTGLWFAGANGALQRTALGDVAFAGSGSVGRRGAVAFAGSTARDPSELYYLAPGTIHPKRLTDYNRDIASLDLGTSREFIWRNDGFEEDGVLTCPVSFGKLASPSRRKTYPLVLVIHGGPTFGASTRAFDPLVQILAGRGFIVLQPNYRGSDNMGFKYAHAIIGSFPIEGPGSDVVAGVKALEATGAIDTSRIGVSGWSAGGWLTSWLITRYDLWKAAVTGAAVDNAVMQYTLSEINSYMAELFGGVTPWQPGGMAIYLRSSPISYARNVRAATLILSDTTDPRVPTPEAYEFYSALRDLGKTAEFIAIPAYGHHPSDPERRKEVDRLWSAWMVKYLAPQQ